MANISKLILWEKANCVFIFFISKLFYLFAGYFLQFCITFSKSGSKISSFNIPRISTRGMLETSWEWRRNKLCYRHTEALSRTNWSQIFSDYQWQWRSRPKCTHQIVTLDEGKQIRPIGTYISGATLTQTLCGAIQRRYACRWPVLSIEAEIMRRLMKARTTHKIPLHSIVRYLYEKIASVQSHL